MSFFTDAEALWIKAGGPPDQAPIAAAIAATESSNGTSLLGDQAYSGTGAPSSFGYWQIHTFDRNGPVNTLPGGKPYDDQRLTNDPQYNAEAAVNVYRSQGFRAWSTYGTETYYENLAAGTGRTLAEVKAGDIGPATPTDGTTPPERSAPTAPTAPVEPGSSTLHVGSRGAAVADVQAQLGVKIDGVYGPKTEAAVRTYQTTHGLSVDGVVGDRTRASLGRDGQRVLREGATGRDVAGLQEQVGARPDGNYGPETAAAVERFQARHHLAVDGVVGSQTRAALTQERHAEFGAASPVHPAAPTPPAAHPAPPPHEPKAGPTAPVAPATPSQGPPGWTSAPSPAGTHKYIAPDLQSFERAYRADATHTKLSMRYDETSDTLTATYENAKHDTFVSTVRTSDPRDSHDVLTGSGSVTLAPGAYVIADGRHQTPTQGEGPAFTQVLNRDGSDGLRDVDGRIHTQIGLHGGGSGLANPQAPLQPLTGTDGCIRLHNVDATTVASLSIESGKPIPFQIESRAPRAVEVQDAATRLRSEGGPSLPAVTSVVKWDGKPHTGTLVEVDGNTWAQHVGRGEYVLYDVNHDFKGHPPSAEGRSMTVDSRGVVSTPQAQPHLQPAHR